MRRLEGKVAMVTGCGGERGFGRAIARRLAAEGADLLLTDVAQAGTRVVSAKPVTGWRGLERGRRRGPRSGPPGGDRPRRCAGG